MKKKINQAFLLTLSLLLAGTVFNSFTKVVGGEGYRIFVNNKLIAERFGDEMKNVLTITLTELKATDEISIRYFHCGQAGKKRHLSLRDEQKHVLKQWYFTDENYADASMSCPLKEIISTKRSNASGELYLYYASDELPAGRLLATIKTS